MGDVSPAQLHRPYTLVAELSYRCPLRCVYCSNPSERAIATRPELDADTWQHTLSDAEGLGVVQVHFTGGEPLVRSELESLVAHAHTLGLYSSLITSAIGLTRERLAGLARAGLDHVQISIQGTSEADALAYGGRVGLAQKLQAMQWVRELELPLTINVVLHRHNIAQVPELIELALRMGAERLELANTQYLGWALMNRDLLLPTSAQLQHARAVTQGARERLRGRMELLFVLPDYHAGIARPCMQGWAERYIVVSPDGLVLPCHQAHSLPGLAFERVTERPLRDIWRDSPALNAYRGEQWMEEPCRSCDKRHQDFGGCRCQAFQLTGRLTATDPACRLAPEHAVITEALQRAAAGASQPLQTTAAAPFKPVQLRYRRMPRDS
ncbi:MAG: pyrroloquinoline quinone biosynthesis protein PqqE [Polyangiales bacterium]